jgi:hypothetical protein
MESVIAYTDRLWKSLEERPPRSRRRVVVETRGRLGPWVATLTRSDGLGYAIAVAEHSGLSLVFAISSVDAFKPAMIAALRMAFEDFGLPVTALAEEIDDIQSAAFVRLRDVVTLYELEFLESICGADVPHFTDDLRRVQLDLNDFPRRRQTPCEPRLGAPLLFGVHTASSVRQ